MTVDLDAVRMFLAWGQIDARTAVQAREHLITLVVAQEHAIKRLRGIRALVPHWRTAALGAETSAERETWLLCAEQLIAVLDEEIHP